MVISPDRINDIYLELKNDLILNGTKSTPNAVGVLFRVFIEMSIHHYLETKQIELEHSTLKEKIEKTAQYMSVNKLATKQELKYIRSTTKSAKTDILKHRQIQRLRSYLFYTSRI